jgi:Ca2+/Na+ antiporter
MECLASVDKTTLFSTPFIDPSHVTNAQLGFLFVVYMYVLLSASNLISDGSELLLFVPKLAGIVGSVVLPVLGAVPDGMMILFSGLGADPKTEVAVGVGALAGSTIMLLTAPWFLSIVAGRVEIENGDANYRASGVKDGVEWSKLRPGNRSLFETGVRVLPLISENARLMIGTAGLYMLVQIPASLAESSGQSELEQAATENKWAGIGCLLCAVSFVAYCIVQYKNANTGAAEAKTIDVTVRAIQNREVSLLAALGNFMQNSADAGDDNTRSLLGLSYPGHDKRLQEIVRPFFKMYDINGDHTIDFQEFTMLMHDLHMPQEKDELERLWHLFDLDGNGSMDFDEFAECCKRCAYDLTADGRRLSSLAQRRGSKTPVAPLADEEAAGEHASGSEDSEEEEDLPEDIADLPVEQQQREVLKRSFLTMGSGTLLVLLFSGPMVDVMSEIGKRLDISAFYVSFVLAPIASNSSELVASYNYAAKKTPKTITIALVQLEGAACMNNTFCLLIFYLLVFVRRLAWEFTAETVAIVVAELLVGMVAMSKKVHTVGAGLAVLWLYPISLLMVYYMENVLGWD